MDLLDCISEMKTFFAIFPTEQGPIIFYKDKEYLITRELNILLEKTPEIRIFKIVDYNLEIEYHESPYIGIDIWSDEIDVDLFYMIEQKYKDDQFYKLYTTV
ncbi:hypothetical protein LJC58_10345 [Lachnospiraceae bacterium OttesenSCG-928-D06]|nr:hypothetical protein [Lachnospiraceae bacterium OttesenSCG-928-D06]